MTSFKALRRSIKYNLLVAMIRLLLAATRILPRPATKKLFGFLGGLAFGLLKGERRKTIANLTFAYGRTKSDAEIRAMAREVFVNLGITAAEFAIKWHAHSHEAFFSDLKVTGAEHFRNAYQNGNGFICVTGHIGCWEAIPWAISMLGFPAGAVGRAHNNERLNRLIVESRERAGFKLLPLGSSYKTIVNFLKENHALGMLIDVDTSVKGIFLDFYGKPAYTPVGAAMLALDAGAGALPIVYLKEEDSTFHLVIGEEFKIQRSGDRDADLRANTEIFHKWLEQVIREHPTQWVWMHERWKTTPEKLAEIEDQRMRDRELRRKAARHPG
jgi:Kdo2-lipid IVA lauroyltransferase/acyltransferase